MHLCGSLWLSEHFPRDGHDCPRCNNLKRFEVPVVLLTARLREESDLFGLHQPRDNLDCEPLHLLSSERRLVLAGFLLSHAPSPTMEGLVQLIGWAE